MWRDFIHDFARQSPEKTAIVDWASGRRYTFAALDAEIGRWARYLHSQGVGRGERVACLAPNRLEHITLFFACARLAAILVPLNHRLSSQELAEIIQRVEPVCFVGEGESPFPGAAGYQSWKTINLEQERPEPPPLAVADDEPLLMLFTSGTTGTPKGVLLHAGMLMANMAATIEAGVLLPGDISIANTPFFHTGGYNVFTLPLLSIGGTLILFEKFDPGGVLAAIQHEGITVFWGVPTMFQALYDHPAFTSTDFSRIRFFLSGGGPLSLTLIQGYHQRQVPFKQGFGLTEVGPNCFLHETRDAFTRPDSIGKPMAHSRVKVVDGEGHPVGVDQVGELLMTGPHLCKGYWREDERFKQSLREGYFATGDLVRVDAEGFFYVVGRKKEMYISGGENVYPSEVEKPLVLHPEIRQAVVVKVPDPKWGEVGAAFVVSQRPLTLEEVRHYLEPRLARYKHPHYLFSLEALPLLANGKIDRRALEAHGLEYINNRQSEGV